MKNLIVKIFLIFLFPIFLNGQAIYNGHVQDVANRSALVGVKVELLNSPLEQISNSFGDFIIKNTEVDSIINPINSYRFFNNSLIWDGDFAISLEMYSIDGREVLRESDLGNSGSYLFPDLPIGIYLLRISTVDEVQSFKVFSNGEYTMIADREAIWHRSTVMTKPDTLILTKEGYHQRAISLSGRDTFLNISLLKKENDELHYFNELIDPIAFDLISSSPARSNDGGVDAVKLIYNTEDELMYYINTKRYPLHFNFAQKILEYSKGHAIFNQTQYQENDDRYLYMSNLNYYKSLDKYILHLVSANEMSCEQIKLIYDKIIATSYLEGKLFLLANRPEFNLCDVPIITPEELYDGQNYQALNLAENYGYLNKVELDDLENTYLGRHDIVLLNGIPNDVSVVAGIITTEFQTPLSHINVLSHNRNTPNMALRDGWENDQMNSFLGELVYLNVRSDSFEIRSATLAEATAFWSTHEPHDTIKLFPDLSVQGLVNLHEADYTSLDVVGGKASNFAEILNVSIDGNPIPTPEDAFAIPFYYYDKHLKDSGLDIVINQMLVNEDFINSPAIRKAMLEDLQDQIKAHPLDPGLLDLVKDRINDFQDFYSYRFRSSTNAEDLESFSGAGLYSSYSAKRDHPTKTIDRAIKKVWASLWNWRAFEERGYYNIVHTSCAMGILVHRSFPNEDANGVLITKNLYNSNPGFIINVQYKEFSIVFPEPGILNDQLILFTWSVIPGQEFMIEYLTFSNIPALNGATVMTDVELMELGTYAKALKKHFYENVPHDCDCTEQDFGLDIEFKVDSTVSERKIYIKQARFYK